MQLFIEGHNHALGYAVSRCWTDQECSALPPATDREVRPVRYFRVLRRAVSIVLRYNRRFGGAFPVQSGG